MFSKQLVSLITRQLSSNTRLTSNYLNKRYLNFSSKNFSASAQEATKNAETPLMFPADVDPKIQGIVEQISKLTLLEVAELNQALKTSLNIPDAPMMAFAASTASAKPADEDEGVSKSVQTSFTLKLNKFDDTKKVALIKEIKGVVEGLNLVQAKKFVESVPQVVKSNISKEEAEKLKASLEASGATCTIE